MESTQTAATSSGPITGPDTSTPEVTATESSYLRQTAPEIDELCRNDARFSERLVRVLERQQDSAGVHRISRPNFDRMISVAAGRTRSASLDDRLCKHMAMTALIVFASRGLNFSNEGAKLIRNFKDGFIKPSAFLAKFADEADFAEDDRAMVTVIAKRFPVAASSDN